MEKDKKVKREKIYVCGGKYYYYKDEMENPNRTGMVWLKPSKKEDKE